MNKNLLMLSGPILTFVIVGTLAQVGTAGNNKEAVSEAAIQRAAKNPKATRIHAALDKKSRGSVDEGAVKKRLTEFLAEYNEQTGAPRNYKKKGGENINGFKPEAIMVLYDDPGDNPNAVVPMRIGITLPQGFSPKLKGQLDVVNVVLKAVEVKGKGSYKKLRQTGPRLARAAGVRLRGQADKPDKPVAVVKLLTDPTETPEEQNEFELILPTE
jgi:hypothetical protein